MDNTGGAYTRRQEDCTILQLENFEQASNHSLVLHVATGSGRVYTICLLSLPVQMTRASLLDQLCDCLNKATVSIRRLPE